MASLFRRFFRHPLVITILTVVFLATMTVHWGFDKYLQRRNTEGHEPKLVLHGPTPTSKKQKDISQLETKLSRYECLSSKVSPTIGKYLREVGLKPKQHVAFLKVHKSASSTLQNVFYRYGIIRNLSFVLPEQKNQLRFSVERGKHAKLIPAPDNKTRYDILANHAVFDENIFSSLLHNDTIYVAIMREPTKNFISGVMYFRYLHNVAYLKSIPENRLFPLLIHQPAKYEPKNLRASFTYNVQANDFGLTLDHIVRINDTIVNRYLANLNKIFSLVLIADYFDESIVLMKRYLNWELKDILFITVNDFKGKRPPRLTKSDRNILKERNYLDYRFYEFFYKRFWTQMSCEESDIMEEVEHFRQVKNDVTDFCRFEVNLTWPLNTNRYFAIDRSKWNRYFRVFPIDCKYMKTSEIDFFTNLQKVQQNRVKVVNEAKKKTPPHSPTPNKKSDQTKKTMTTKA